jgi:hypothetical protein
MINKLCRETCRGIAERGVDRSGLPEFSQDTILGLVIQELDARRFLGRIGTLPGDGPLQRLVRRHGLGEPQLVPDSLRLRVEILLAVIRDGNTSLGRRDDLAGPADDLRDPAPRLVALRPGGSE